MRILSIDPGTLESAWLMYNTKDGSFSDFGIEPNIELRERLKRYSNATNTILAIEQICSYGMSVGQTVFDTVQWTGRFIECWGNRFVQIPRIDVKMHLCHNTRAKDSNIRQAIIDRYGGQDKAIGNKKCPKCKGKGWFGAGRATCPVCGGSKWKYPPGPLCDVSSDVWSALAVAIFAAENMEG